MDWKLFLQLAATVLVAFGGGWLGHRLSARRDLLNERRKLRVAYLLEAYRRLEGGSNRHTDVERSWQQIESAIADIQLLGSPAQVALARRFSQAMSQQQKASLDDLISDLRRSLREELHLPAVNDPVTYLRFGALDASSFDTTLVEVTRNVTDAKLEGASVAPPETRDFLDQQEHIPKPVAQIISEWLSLEDIVRDALQRKGVVTTKLGATALLQSALQCGVITEAQYRSLRGLNVMRNLAVHGPHSEIDEKKVQEFLHLTGAMKTVLEISDKASSA